MSSQYSNGHKQHLSWLYWGREQVAQPLFDLLWSQLLWACGVLYFTSANHVTFRPLMYHLYSIQFADIRSVQFTRFHWTGSFSCAQSTNLNVKFRLTSLRIQWTGIFCPQFFRMLTYFLHVQYKHLQVMRYVKHDKFYSSSIFAVRQSPALATLEGEILLRVDACVLQWVRSTKFDDTHVGMNISMT